MIEVSRFESYTQISIPSYHPFEKSIHLSISRSEKIPPTKFFSNSSSSPFNLEFTSKIAYRLI
ncbi:MAG: hypothetical protein QW303_07415, partial [Nitrososphaerota archaeon]